MNCISDPASFIAGVLESFETTPRFTQCQRDLRLPPRLWDIALACDGHKSVYDVARQQELPEAPVLEALLVLERKGLVRRVHTACPWNLPEITPVSVEPAAAAPLVTVPDTTEEPSPARPPRTREAGAPALKLVLKGRGAAKPARISLNLKKRDNPIRISIKASQPQEPKKAEPATNPELGQTTGWRMQPILDAIQQKAGGDPMVGQLLAYRIFLRVPGNLLLEAGIRSVCLIEPELRINNPLLKKALEQALSDVAGLAWPSAKTAAA